MKNTWLLLVLFLAGSMALQPALAKKHYGGVRGVRISGVDVADSKVTLTIDHNHQVTTYLVPIGTALTLDGGSVKLSQIENGMYVRSYTESDAGTLSQLDVSHHTIK